MVTSHSESLTLDSTAAHPMFVGEGAREAPGNKIMGDGMPAEGQSSSLEARSRRKPENSIL